MHKVSLIRGTKKVHTKNFLTATDKELINKKHEEGKTIEEIASFMAISRRQVSTYILEKERGQVNIFTEIEDAKIIELYSNGIVKPALMSKYISTKAPWMIRNRIKQLKRKKMLDHNMLKYTKFMPNQTSIDEQEEKIKLEDQVAQIENERSLFGINADELFRDDLFHDTQTLFSYEFFDNNADTSLTDGYEINMFID